MVFSKCMPSTEYPLLTSQKLHRKSLVFLNIGHVKHFSFLTDRWHQEFINLGMVLVFLLPITERSNNYRHAKAPVFLKENLKTVTLTAFTTDATEKTPYWKILYCMRKSPTSITNAFLKGSYTQIGRAHV